MPTEPPEWTTRDQLLAAALARGLTHAEAAAEAGVSTRTVANRRADPSFRALVDEARNAIIEAVVGKLVGAAGQAVDELAKLMKSAESDAARVSAARAILSQLIAIQTHAELAKRVAELEERQEEFARRPAPPEF